MAVLNKKLFSSAKFKKELNRIIDEGDLSILTASKIRKELEDIFGFDRNSMKGQPWKDMLSTMIDEYAANKETEEQSEDEQNEEMDTAGSDEDDTNNNNNVRVKDEVNTDSEMDDKEKLAEPIKQEQRSSDNSKDDEGSDDDSKIKSDSDMSEAASPPPEKKRRQQKTQSAKQKSTGKKKSSNKDDDSIKRLKSYISKCGVRKIWRKELDDCITKKAQISKLKQILEDLGVHGRPTVEKCEALKAQRELKAEIDSLNPDNILKTTGDDGPILRSSGLATKRKRRLVIQDDSDESGDDRANAPLDVSFLGNQSDGDSD